jgi:hypothetical protein
MSYEQKQQFKERIFRHILELDAESLNDLLKEPIPYDNLNDVRYSAPVVPVSVIYDKDTGVGHLNGDVPLVYREHLDTGPHWPGYDRYDHTVWPLTGKKVRYPHLLIHYNGLNPFQILQRLWNVCHRPPNCGEIGYLPNGREIVDFDSTNSELGDLHGRLINNGCYGRPEFATTYCMEILPMMNVLFVHIDADSLSHWQQKFCTTHFGLGSMRDQNPICMYYPSEGLLRWAVQFASPNVVQRVLQLYPLTMDDLFLGSLRPIVDKGGYDRDSAPSDWNDDFEKSVFHVLLQHSSKELLNSLSMDKQTVLHHVVTNDDSINIDIDQHIMVVDKLLEMGADPTIKTTKSLLSGSDKDGDVKYNVYDKFIQTSVEIGIFKHLWKRRLVELDPKRWPTVDDFDDISVEELKAMYEGHPLVVVLEQDEPPAKKRKI